MDQIYMHVDSLYHIVKLLEKNNYLIPRYFICDIKTKIQYLIHKP